MVFTRPFSPGKALEYLDVKNMRWPGYGLPEDNTMQSIETECMREDEYGLFFNSPADFAIRHYLPRRFGTLECLSMLPELSDDSWLNPGVPQNLAILATEPKVEAAFKKLQDAGRELKKWLPRMKEFDQLLMDYGVIQLHQGGAMPPFDVISIGYRGMKGAMLDMYRRPDRLLEACDCLLGKTLSRPLPPPNEYGNIRLFMTVTRGSCDFMSKKQFDTFYWPTFSKLVRKLIDQGGTPCIFFEGDFTSRLEYLLEFPKGKILARLDTTDIFRAKEVLKDHVCIEGNVPCSLLQIGSVQEVKDYCKKLIDVVGKGGGYILGPRSSTDEVKPENLKAMIEFSKEYGRY